MNQQIQPEYKDQTDPNEQRNEQDRKMENESQLARYGLDMVDEGVTDTQGENCHLKEVESQIHRSEGDLFSVLLQNQEENCHTNNSQQQNGLNDQGENCHTNNSQQQNGSNDQGENCHTNNSHQQNILSDRGEEQNTYNLIVSEDGSNSPQQNGLQQAKQLDRIRLFQQIFHDLLQICRDYHKTRHPQFDSIFRSFDKQTSQQIQKNSTPNSQFLKFVIYHYCKAHFSGQQTKYLKKYMPQKIQEHLEEQAQSNLQKSHYMQKIPGLFINFLSCLKKCSQIISKSDQTWVDSIINRTMPRKSSSNTINNEENVEIQSQQIQNSEKKKQSSKPQQALVKSIDSLIQWCIVENQSVRGSCTKNLAQFFGKYIFPLVTQKLKEVYYDLIKAAGEILIIGSQLTQAPIRGLTPNQIRNISPAQILQNFDTCFPQGPWNYQQTRFRPLLEAFISNKNLQMRITRLADLWYILGTKEIVHLMRDVITEQKLVVKVTYSFEKNKIKACTRGYYYCFIPRLMRIIQQIQERRKAQKTDMIDQMEQQVDMNVRQNGPQNKWFNQMNQQEKREFKKRIKQDVKTIGYQGHFWEHNIKRGMSDQQKKQVKKLFSGEVSMQNARCIKGQYSEQEKMERGDWEQFIELQEQQQ